MKENIFIIHGSYGSPEGNWFPWLKSQLEQRGHRVFIPKFPTPENQSLENWLAVFKKYEQHLDEKSIVIGHSIGAAFTILPGAGHINAESGYTDFDLLLRKIDIQ